MERQSALNAPGTVDYVFSIRVTNESQELLEMWPFGWSLFGSDGWWNPVSTVRPGFSACSGPGIIHQDVAAGELVEGCIAVPIPADVRLMHLMWDQHLSPMVFVVDLTVDNTLVSPVASPETTPID